MKKRHIVFILSLLLFIGFFAFFGLANAQISGDTVRIGNPETIANVTFTSGTFSGRHYRLHVPMGSSCSSYSLIVLLHGGGMVEDGSGNDIRNLSGLESSYSDSNCVIVAYPFSTGWNFMPELGLPSTGANDDMGFVNAVVDDIAQRYSSLNSGRVTLAGFSAGAAQALKMLCEGESLRFHNIFSLAGPMSQGERAKCSFVHSQDYVPQYVRLIYGTSDDAVLYLGGPSSIANTMLLSVPDELYPLVVNLIGSGVEDSGHFFVGSTESLSGTTLLQKVTGSMFYLGDSNTLTPHVALDTIHGSCTGGGIDRGNCNNPEGGGGHRWLSSPCDSDHGGPGCFAPYAGMGKTSWLMNLSRYIIDQTVFGEAINPPPPPSSNPLRVKRVDSDSSLFVPLTSAWFDSRTPDTNNPSDFTISSGSHTVYTSNITGYTVTAGICTFPQGDSSSCAVGGFPYTAVCNSTGCSIPVTIVDGQSTKVVFRYEEMPTVVATTIFPRITPTSATYDVVIAGGGTSGVAAAIQAGREGLRVALVEETDWIGGQMTTAGVSTMDEGTATIRDVGIYEDFATRIKNYYQALGKSVSTCYWSTSSLCFEPRVGQIILKQMVDEANAGTGRISVFIRAPITSVVKNGSAIVGLTLQNGATLRGAVVIDATEYGDLLALAGQPYRVGNSTSASVNQNACVQSITYTAIIKKYPNGVPPNLKILTPPPGYEATVGQFRWFVTRNGSQSLSSFPVNWAFHNAYRGVPNSSETGSYTGWDYSSVTKTGVNWANDYPVTASFIENKSTRKNLACEAKLRTIQFLYYMQKELGETNWSVADDEGFDTAYNREENNCPNIPAELKEVEYRLPQMPYVREARRAIGDYTLTAKDIYRTGTPPVAVKSFSDVVAMGDYPTDLHNCKANSDLELAFESTSDIQGTGGLFQIPFSSLVSSAFPGLIFAEKNISQTRLANGATRLQPSTMLVGQAAGEIAAEAVKYGVAPNAVNVPALQLRLALPGFFNVAPPATNSLRVKRANPDTSPFTEQMTSSWVDSGAPNSNNPYNFMVSAGPHTVYTSQVPGYKVTGADICFGAGCTTSAANTGIWPLTPTCDSTSCSVPVTVTQGQEAKVVFEYGATVATPQTMHYCRVPGYSVGQTLSQYTDTASCASNLALYMPDQTTGVCYTTSSAASAVCITQ